MTDDPIRLLLDRVGGGYRPKPADYQQLPLRRGAENEVRDAIAKTASSVATCGAAPSTPQPAGLPG